SPKRSLRTRMSVRQRRKDRLGWRVPCWRSARRPSNVRVEPRAILDRAGRPRWWSRGAVAARGDGSPQPGRSRDGARRTGRGAPDGEEGEGAIGEVVRTEVAGVLALRSSNFSDDQPLYELDLDSLRAMELRNALARRTGLKLPSAVAFDHPTVRELAAFLATA